MLLLCQTRPCLTDPPFFGSVSIEASRVCVAGMLFSRACTQSCRLIIRRDASRIEPDAVVTHALSELSDTHPTPRVCSQAVPPMRIRSEDSSKPNMLPVRALESSEF